MSPKVQFDSQLPETYFSEKQQAKRRLLASKASVCFSPELVEQAAKYFALKLLLADIVPKRRRMSTGLEDDHLESLGLPVPKESQKRPSVNSLRENIQISLDRFAPKHAIALKALSLRLAPIDAALGLDDRAHQFLLLVLCNSSCPVFRVLTNNRSVTSSRAFAKVLAQLLGGKSTDWETLTNRQHPLYDCSLLEKNDSTVNSDLEDQMRASDSVVDCLYATAPLHGLLLKRSLSDAKVSSRVLSDFAHLGSRVALTQAILRPHTDQAGSAHVLFAGPPGTGKTELALLLADTLGLTAKLVRDDGEEGAAASRSERLSHYRLATKLLGRTRDTLVIFDEVEDVFTGEHWTHLQRHESRGKGWMTRLLETTQVPTIWITNSLESIDPAYLRRFDTIVQFDTPPRSVRHRLLLEAVGTVPVPPKLLSQAAESEQLTPADTVRLARVLPRALAAGIPASEAFTHLLTSRPDGVSRTQLAGGGRGGVRLPFRIDWLNVNAELPTLVSGLQLSGSGTLLFSGPPGTGKTEFAKQLALALDRPLHLKKASDLIDKYIGETEKRIAHAFERAQQDNAILFLDEADSFLQSRERATHSWQVTEVNELLAQLDEYGGLCILATNHVDALDRAVLRRMDVKLQFGPLRPAAVEEAYRQALLALGCEAAPTSENLYRVRGLSDLCFGDFAAVLRGLRLRCGQDDVATVGQDSQLAEALIEELRCKRIGTGRTIGFT